MYRIALLNSVEEINRRIFTVSWSDQVRFRGTVEHCLWELNPDEQLEVDGEVLSYEEWRKRFITHAQNVSHPSFETLQGM